MWTTCVRAGQPPHTLVYAAWTRTRTTYVGLWTRRRRPQGLHTAYELVPTRRAGMHGFCTGYPQGARHAPYSSIRTMVKVGFGLPTELSTDVDHVEIVGNDR